MRKANCKNQLLNPNGSDQQRHFPHVLVWLSTSLRVRPVTLLAYVVVRDSARKDR